MRILKDNKFLKGVNIFFSAFGVLSFFGLILLLITNLVGFGTLLSVVGLIKTQSLYDIEFSQMIQGSTIGIVESLEDPYSQYLSQEKWEELNIKLDAKFGGIGIYLLQDPDEGHLTVVSPIKGTPAAEAGIQNGDIIIGINGETTQNMTQDQAVALMRGDPGTQVEIEIFRPEDSEEYTFKIVREIINVPSVEDDIIHDVPKIGYIHLNQFHSRSPQEMAESINGLGEDQIDGLILDLRNNGGGDFDSAIYISDYFLDGDEVVSVAGATGQKEVFRAAPGNNTDIPMVVLVNQNSASASEILAGALQDNGRAVLVGENTFGKGLVQKVYPLNDGGALKLTTQKYYTPKGTDIHEIGINPDYQVENTAEEDLQLKRAKEVLKQQLL
ncbi:S41 family peptidase [Candidatus Syntrophocurvum alkaliphilum]|uniref:S41 family peptidase n=1 Tax=Candidatus Syntrophocurvum alkaliphilum TaxID=2293317 RepID=UPI001FAA6856|nr:S41 family peptidase [Candidatus Syntrophocurvum alkaliphilum]